MSRPVARLVAVGAVCGLAYAAYRLLLTPAAREDLRESARSVSDAVRRLDDFVSERRGVVMEEDELPNRRKTEQQWEALGY